MKAWVSCALLILLGCAQGGCVEGVSHATEQSDAMSAINKAAPQIVGGGAIPALGVGATAAFPGGTATGGAAGAVNISLEQPCMLVVTPGSGPVPTTNVGVNPAGVNTAFTVNLARSDTNVGISVAFNLLCVAVPAQL